MDSEEPRSHEERFYVLQDNPIDANDAETEFLDSDCSKMADAPTCPRCGKYTGLVEWQPPYQVELECWGSTFGDIAFGAAQDFLVSERFRVGYEERGLSGLEGFEPVRVTHVKRRRPVRGEPPPYFHVSIVRSSAAVDQERSGFRWKVAPECPVCRLGTDLKYFKRIVIEEGSWPGKDIFIPRGVSRYITSRRFKEFCEEYRIANAVLMPAEEYEYSSAYQDEVRARELLGLPLSGLLLEKVRANGEILRYYKKTNELVIASPDGAVRHHFKPVEGVDYWNGL